MKGNKWLEWLDENFELAVMALMLVVMSVLSFTNVIMRYCFHNALSWSDEISCYCLALSAFFSLPCTIRRGLSIRVDTFVGLLPQNVQHILEIVCSVGMIVFLICLLGGSVTITQNAAKINQSSPALQIPMAYLYGTMTFTVVLAILRYIQAIVRMLRHKGEEK